MYTKLKAFIGVAIISLSLFATPVGLFLSPHGPNNTPTLVMQPTVAFAETECISGTFNVNFTICVADLLEFAIFTPAWYLASITGQFLDFFVEYSISSQTYSQGSDFVHRGWALVRDIVNIFFIFILLYIAIGTILNLSQVNTKKMLVRVIIIALLINFSLFFTKIVIDASNILARAFIGSIDITVVNENGQPVESSTTQFSAAIVSQFDAQKLLDEEEGSVYYNYAQENAEAAGTLRIVMLLSGAAILLVMCWTFLTTAFLFLSRVITLWLVMITAPIAFISIVLPFNIPKLGHKEWTKKLFESAFMAPIFLFFMYLLIVFLDLGFFDNVALGSSQGFGDALLRILIPFAIVMGLVLAAAKMAKSMSGEVGAAIAKVGGAAMGLAAAAATGGTAMLARGTVGRFAANKMATSQMGGRAGRLMRATGNKLKSGSMDWRQTSAGQKIMKEMGMNNFGAGSAFQGKGGGYQGFRDRYQQGREADAKQRIENASSSKKAQWDAVENELAEFEDHFADTMDQFKFKIKIARQKWQDDPDNEEKHKKLQDLIKDQATFLNTKMPEFKDAEGNAQSWNDIDGRRIEAKNAVTRTRSEVTKKAGEEIANEGFFASGGQDKGWSTYVGRTVRGNRNPAQNRDYSKPKKDAPKPPPKRKAPSEKPEGGDSGGEK